MQNSEAIVKIWTKGDVQNLIMTNDKAVVKAIKCLYARQTEGEKQAGVAVVHNGRGFNSKDAAFFTSIAKALPRYNDNMTYRQLATSRKMLPKYWRQLLEVIVERGGQVEGLPKPPKSEVAPAPISAAAETTYSEEWAMP